MINAQKPFLTVTLVPRENARLVTRSGTLIPKINVQTIAVRGTIRMIQINLPVDVRNVTSFVLHVPDSPLRPVPPVSMVTSLTLPSVALNATVTVRLARELCTLTARPVLLRSSKMEPAPVHQPVESSIGETKPSGLVIGARWDATPVAAPLSVPPVSKVIK